MFLRILCPFCLVFFLLHFSNEQLDLNDFFPDFDVRLTQTLEV